MAEEKEAEPTLKMPRDPDLRVRIRTIVKGFSPEAKEAFYQQAGIWKATANNGRDVIGVLNHRYDLCVFECAPPAPWFAVAFDTQTRERIVAQDFPNGQAIGCPECASACAAALGESVQNRLCYTTPRFRI